MFRIHSSLLNLGKVSQQNKHIKFQLCKRVLCSVSSEPLPSTEDAKTGGVRPVAASGKKPSRPPLAKNFFAGVVDKELLAYPEVIARDDMKQLQNDLLPLKAYFTDSVDTKSIDATRSIPPSVIDAVRDLGLYALNVPYDYDGKNWQWSDSLMASEQECRCPDIALSLLSHRVVIDVIKEHGSDEQKQRYLPKLASGMMIATEAIAEYDIAEYELMSTKAEYNPDNQMWYLKGEKSFVITGPKPSGAQQLFMVIAQTQRPNVRGDAALASTVFLVDSAAPGVTVGEQHLSFGCRGAQATKVKFDNVTVSNSCVLGRTNESNDVIETLTRSSRLRSSLIGLAMSKHIVNHLSEYLLNSKQSGVPYNDMEINQAHLSEAVCSTYAMESMIYLTAGLLDEYEAQDVALEAAITKLFTARQLLKTSTKYMDIIGAKSLLAGEHTELALRNAAHFYTHSESVDMLSLYIAMAGLKHAGVIMNDTVQKDRNPLYHPMNVFKKLISPPNIENPQTKMALNEYLHPSLEGAAKNLEHSIARLQMSVHTVFGRHGSTIIDHHIQLQRLSEMITLIYAMFASLSRASRSYCIGLPLAEKELLTALALSKSCSDQVKTLCQHTFHGQFLNNDKDLTNLASQVTKSKGYFAAHPLTYNF